MRYHILRPAGTSGTESSSAAEADWIARSTGPGVIWAQGFDDDAAVTKFLGSKPDSEPYIFRNPGDGIRGKGCLEMRWPQGAGPRFGWLRPIFPVPGDINRPGWPILPLGDYANFHPEMFTNYMGGGHVVHPDYLTSSPWNTSGGAPQPQIVRASKLYFQYRVKFSASRFAAAEASGKYLMFTGWYSNCAQELVTKANTSYGGGWFEQYTNVGSNTNSFLRNPQVSGGSEIQPGGDKNATCVVGPPTIGLPPIGNNACFTYTPDTWITVMWEIELGRQAGDISASDPPEAYIDRPANANAKNTSIRVLFAYPGDTSWRVVTNKTDYIWFYAGDYLSGGSNAQPFGLSVINFTPFNGGPQEVPVVVPNGWYHRIDEPVMSTQPIPIPAVQPPPSWYQVMADSTWTQLLAGSAFTAVAQANNPNPSVLSDTGVRIVVETYNGAVVDQKRGEIILAANGGHHDYAGDEVYACRVRTDSPAWYRLTDRTPDNLLRQDLSGNVAGRVDNLDGLPRSMHSWNAQVYCEGLGKLMYPYTTDFASGLSGNSPGAWMFDRDLCGDNYAAFPIAYSTVAANGGNGPGYWRYMGSSITSMPGDYEACPGCWDPLNREALGFQKIPQSAPIAGESAWSVNPISGVITRYNVQPASGNPVINWVACTTNTWPPLAVANDVNSGDIYVWDLSKRSTTRFVRKTPSGSNPASGAGWYGMWDPASYAFLFYNAANGGTTVGKLKMNDPTDPANSSWTYSTVSAAGGGSTPPAANANSYSKAQRMDMGAGRSALVVVSNQGVWAYKIPAAGV